jgi:catechol 2,3-dioxygenase-like lactoylglutathione lyase family enzyme
VDCRHLPKQGMGLLVGVAATTARATIVRSRAVRETGEDVEINGIAHVQLSVTDFVKSRDFYRALLPALGLRVQYDAENVFYCIGGRTGVLITPCAEAFRSQGFDQQRPGLHHLCFRARERADVDELHRLLQEIGATIVHAPEEGPWAKGYYSLLFEDPDGIRLEINHIPGKGNLDPAVELPRTPPP